MSDKASKYDEVVQQALSDPDYKERLLSDPKGTLQQAGFDIPDDVDVEIVLDTATTMHFVLPVDREGEGDSWIC